MTEPRVVVILVNWNGKEDTLECLRSLREDQYKNKHVIVVDNGSSDDSPRAIRFAFSDTEVLETGDNLGFTGGNNVGIARALEQHADYIFILNNDTTLEPDAVRALVQTAESYPGYGMFTPLMYAYDPPRDIWFAGSRLDLSHGIALHDNTRLPQPTDAPYEVPWTSGCAMFFRAGLLDSLGGFDDRYYYYYEDVDICMRVQKAGSKIAVAPAARIYHKMGRSGSKVSYFFIEYYGVRNHLLLVSTHLPEKRLLASYYALRAGLSRCRRVPPHRVRLSGLLRAVSDHLRGRYGKCRYSAPPSLL